MYHFDYVYVFVSGMYFSLDFVLGVYLLVYHFKLCSAQRMVPSIFLASLAVLLDSVAALLHFAKRVFLPQSSIFFYALPLSDLVVTSLLLLVGFSQLTSRYPSRNSYLAVFVTSLVIYLIYIFTGNIRLFSVLTVLWLAVIFITTVIRVRRFNRRLKFFYSNVGKHRRTWFICILVWAFAVYPIYKFANVSHSYSNLLCVLYSLSMMAVYSVMAYKLTKQIAGASSAITEVSDDEGFVNSELSRPSRSGAVRHSVEEYFTPEQQEELMRQLKKLMEGEKLYRSRDLCVDDLAKRLGINASYFYYFMRDTVKSSFFDFVNCYRIEESKPMLLKGEKVEYVVRKVGFNSDNTFRRAFKKATGFTPSEWRQSQGK